MRLVCHLNANDIQALQAGKLMMVSLVGIDGLSVHFDPDPDDGAPAQVAQITPVTADVMKESPAMKQPPDAAFQCSHCAKSFDTRRGLAKHKTWVKRLAEPGTEHKL